MGTKILLPRGYLDDRNMVLPAPLHRREKLHGSSKANYCNSNHRPKRKPASRSKRPEPRSSSIESSSSDDKKMAKSPVMEKVKILKRGEPLESTIKSEVMKKYNDNYQAVCGSDRSSSTPEMMRKQSGTINLESPVARYGDTYTGSGFSMSPSPSSLPLPSFSKRKSVPAAVLDSATTDLRRLLRLEA